MAQFISIVVPLYNKEKYIQRAINSVLAQTVPDFELIIVDDGSTDESYLCACEIQDHRIRLIRQDNLGVSAARNRGIAEACSELVAFLDADDEFKPYFLEKMLELIDSEPNYGVYGCGYDLGLSDEKIKEKWNPLFPPGWKGIIDDYVGSLTVGCDPFCSSSVIVRKSLIQNLGGFAEGISNGEDIDLWIRASFVTSIPYLSLPLVIYHQDTGDNASRKFNWQNEFFPVQQLRKFLDSNQNIVNKIAAYEFISKYEIRTARALINAGKPVKATLFLWAARRTKFRKKYLRVIIKEWMPALFFVPIYKFIKAIG